jgi:hypothetical protein
MLPKVSTLEVPALAMLAEGELVRATPSLSHLYERDPPPWASTESWALWPSALDKPTGWVMIDTLETVETGAQGVLWDPLSEVTVTL